jgi:hypothetical protein
VVFEFRVENYQVAAVPDVVGAPRPGVGHFHFGADTGCILPGEVIPRSPIWVHLDQGEATYQMIMTLPGERLFTVQLGDDSHRAVPGLCRTITLTVQP